MPKPMFLTKFKTKQAYQLKVKNNSIAFIKNCRGRISNDMKQFRSHLHSFSIEQGQIVRSKKNNPQIALIKKYMTLRHKKIIFHHALLRHFQSQRKSPDICTLIQQYITHDPTIKSLNTLQSLQPLQSSKSRIDPYPTIRKQTDPNKTIVNNSFGELSKTVLSNDNDKAIVLDAETMTSTKKLIEVGYKSHNIYIPNHYDYVCNNMQSQNIGIVDHMLMNDFLEKMKIKLRGKIATIFYDTCGTFNGNATTNIYPKEDIRKMFQYKFFKNNSILGVTFSHRGTKKSDRRKIDEFIVQIAKLNEYHVDVLNSYNHSYQCVFTMFYRVHEIHSIV